MSEVWDRSVPLPSLDGPPVDRFVIEAGAKRQRHQLLRLPSPQPDYAVGFLHRAFTPAQRRRLEPFVGGHTDKSLFMGTSKMYFPFMTTEVKCEGGRLTTAERQNAHSTALAVRGVVEPFRQVHRENEVNREILAFSVCHDHITAEIYAHYPVISGPQTEYYCHLIQVCQLRGKERWLPYRFTMTVYTDWVPVHLKRLRSAIDELEEIVNAVCDIGPGSGDAPSVVPGQV
ncbi:hypothetical protein BJX99DRAFT_252952 [Aspergillus californicus]